MVSGYDLGDLRRVAEAMIADGSWSAQWAALLDFQTDRTRALMLRGAPLVHALPGRLGWEIRLTVQGGLRILERIRKVRGDVFHHRPKLDKWDWAVVLGRSFTI
jgi:phytoene/squalene synthetase